MSEPRFQSEIEAAVRAVLHRQGIREISPHLEVALRLAAMRQHLLEPGTGAHDVYQMAGFTTPEKRELFENLAGCSPRHFVLAVRLELAEKLLASRKVSLTEVARLAGYVNAASFIRAFRNYHGQDPPTFSSEHIKPTPNATEGSPSTKKSPLPEMWRHYLGGTGDKPKLIWAAREVWQRLTHLETQTIGLTFEAPQDLASQERILAVSLGPRLLRSGQHDVSKELRLLAARFQTPALFEYLLEQSRVVGRGDRKKGVWIAELALESLKGLTWRLGAEEMVYQRIRGWSYLGLARRLSGDSSGAEEAFSEALSLSRLSEAPSLVLAELSSFFASFRAFQRRWAEALRFAEDALSNMSPQGDEKLRAETMIVVGGVHGFEGNWPCALSNFQGARERAQSLDDSYLHLSVESHLVWANFKTGHLSEAEASLKRAFDLAKKIGLESAYPHLFWLKGIGAAEKKDLRRAEEALRRAFTGFQNLGDFPCSAAVGLELAIILSWQGKQREVLEVARAALPVLQELQLNEECLVLVAVLEQAIVEQKLETALLFRLRSRIGAELGMLELLREQGGL